MNASQQTPRTFLAVAACAAWLAGCQATDVPLGRPLVSFSGDQIVAQDAEPADGLVAQGRSLEKRGEVDAAIQVYEQALKRQPACGDASWRLAVMYDHQGRWAESADSYQKALAAKPGNADLYCDMGYSLYLQHRWQEAEMNFRQALALSHDHRRAHNNLGLLLARTDRPEEALVEFRTAKCDVADAHANVAYALSLDGRFDDARQHYRRALAADPACDSARRGLRELQTMQARSRTGRSAETPSDTMVELTSATVPPAGPNDVQPVLPPRRSGPETNESAATSSTKTAR